MSLTSHRIAILGAGSVGTALSSAFHRLGHTVRLGSRSPQRADIVAASEALGTEPATHSEVAEWAEIVVLAVPWEGVEATLGALGSLGDRILIDATNPFDEELNLVAEPSGGQCVAQWADGGRVVKAYATIGAVHMDEPDFPGPVRPAMFVCGDDADAKATVSKLVEDTGFEAIDLGGIDRSGFTEALAKMWIEQAYADGDAPNPNLAFAVLRR